jgi:hypothetical protein
MLERMLRLGIIAVLLLCASVYLGAQGRQTASASVQHSCGLTDRQFLENYAVQLESVGMYGNDYLDGNAKASDLISAAQDAARIVRSSAPFDPSLQLVRKYAPAMFLQYAAAAQAREDKGTGAREMYLAYSIGARVQDVFREAQPELAALGCDVSDLL